MRSVTPPEAPSVTALLLAGRRPGIDPLAEHFGVEDKALVSIAGEAMLSRVARTLLLHDRIGQVIVLTQARELLAGHADTAWLSEQPAVAFEASGGSVSEAVAEALARHPDGYPFLVVTADNPLLDRATLDSFLAGAQGAELAVAVVERKTLLARYPESRRTWLKFRGGAYSGANLFWLAAPEVGPVLALWRTIEQQRKRGRAVISAFGPLMLLGVALRLLTLHQAIALAGRRFGLIARGVVLPQAEACIDVDSVADHQLVSQILGERQSSISASVA